MELLLCGSLFFLFMYFFVTLFTFFNLSILYCCNSLLFLLFIWQGAFAHFTTLLSINGFIFLNPQSAWVFSACRVFMSYAVQYSLLWNTTQNELLPKFLSFAKGNKDTQKRKSHHRGVENKHFQNSSILLQFSIQMVSSVEFKVSFLSHTSEHK